MANYRIGNVILQMEEEMSPFVPFLMSEVEQEPQMRLECSKTSWGNESQIKTSFHAETFMISQLSSGDWLYEYCDDSSKMIVSKDYSKLIYYRAEQEDKDALLNLVRLAVQCRLIMEGNLILHASCFAIEDKAVAFTAKSGVGKSTRANIWVQKLGAEQISGDRPCIDVKNLMFFGAPWDGKEQIFRSVCYPIQGICQIRRAPFSRLRYLNKKQAIAVLMEQLFIPMWDTELTFIAMTLMHRLLNKMKLIRLFCDQTEEAAKEVKEILLYHPEQIYKEDMDMKMKDGFVVRNVVGEYMVMPVGENISKFEGTVVINELSAFVLEHMKEPISREDLLALILEEYEVEEETAKKDLEVLLDKFSAFGLIE